MQFQTGNMWSAFDDADLFLITTNATLRLDGELVMGRGIAYEAKARYPQLPVRAGRYLKRHKLDDNFYGILVDVLQDNPIGLFQVKYHFKDKASLILIKESFQMLNELIPEQGYTNVHLNFPGIGHGHLNSLEVLDVIETTVAQDLPLTIWTNR